jgi:SAM-dependent methyltransferase
MVRQALRHSAPERLLDAGCGYGRLSRALKEEYSDLDVTGMDVTENFVKLYKKHTGYDAFIGNVESLPDDIGTFSHILCVTVLMYVAEDRLDETVAGLLRCLAPVRIPAKLDSQSGGSRTPEPKEGGHSFRRKLDSDSEGRWTPGPKESDEAKSRHWSSGLFYQNESSVVNMISWSRGRLPGRNVCIGNSRGPLLRLFSS